ncbi:MAG: hypothetical protein WA809_09490 [Candidatus Dormiibacterota bacterium]
MPATDAPTTIKTKRPTDRSPSYPGVALDRALERAQEFYDQERQNPALVEVALRHWGYKPKSGPGTVTLAALRKFGLLTYEGKGPSLKARLTEDAIGILLRQANDPQRVTAIQQAALRPTLHKELWDRYHGQWPSDTSFALDLRRERHFTESGASEFIAQLKRTMDFAGFRKGGNLPDEEAEKASIPEVTAPMSSSPAAPSYQATAIPAEPPLGPAPTRELRSYAIPFPDGRQGVLQVPANLSEESWELMVAVMKAMKPGIVLKQAAPPPAGPSASPTLTEQLSEQSPDADLE